MKNFEFSLEILEFLGLKSRIPKRILGLKSRIPKRILGLKFRILSKKTAGILEFSKGILGLNSKIPKGIPRAKI